MTLADMVYAAAYGAAFARETYDLCDSLAGLDRHVDAIADVRADRCKAVADAAVQSWQASKEIPR